MLHREAFVLRPYRHGQAAALFSNGKVAIKISARPKPMSSSKSPRDRADPAVRIHAANGYLPRHPRIKHYEIGIEVMRSGIPSDLPLAYERGDDSCADWFSNLPLASSNRIHFDKCCAKE
jgi:hypothetical protein